MDDDDRTGPDDDFGDGEVLKGPLWMNRTLRFADLGACLSAADTANGRLSMKAMAALLVCDSCLSSSDEKRDEREEIRDPDDEGELV